MHLNVCTKLKLNILYITDNNFDNKNRVSDFAV